MYFGEELPGAFRSEGALGGECKAKGVHIRAM